MSKITAKELAAMLDGREYLHEITEAEEQIAKDNELVVMFGSSDALAELRGSINDELGCYCGGELFLNNHGFIDTDDEEISTLSPYVVINVIWKPDCGGLWAYETDIPHETFQILACGDLYCTGIVFNTKDLPGTLEEELDCLDEYRAICPDPEKLKAELERAKQVKRERDEARQAARDAQAEVLRLEGLLTVLQNRAEEAEQKNAALTRKLRAAEADIKSMIIDASDAICFCKYCSRLKTKTITCKSDCSNAAWRGLSDESEAKSK